MKIYIQDKRKFVLVLPNAFLKLIGWGICLDMDKEEKKATQRLVKDAYKVLKQYKNFADAPNEVMESFWNEAKQKGL